MLLQGLALALGFFHFLGADLSLGLALCLALSLGLASMGSHGLGLLLLAAAGGLGFLGLVGGGVGFVGGVRGSNGAGEGISIAALHWWFGIGSAHCLVGAGWFLGASLGGDFCDMMVLTGEFKRSACDR